MNIGIVGLGLIGGSIGLKLQSLNHIVYGVTNNSSNENKAKERKLATLVSQNYEVLQACEIVILALPIQDILNPEDDLKKAIPSKAIVTDVGSIKVPIVKTWEKIHPLFIGSHPMAGNEKKGVNSGDINLFDNAKWIITPTKNTNNKSLKILSKLFHSMNCNVLLEKPFIHDQAVSLISHLPIYLAACLLETVNYEQEEKLLILSREIASTGFADTSRVGGGNPFLGVDIAKNNTANIRNSLKKFRENICEIERIFEDSDWELLQEKLENAANCRELFL